MDDRAIVKLISEKDEKGIREMARNYGGQLRKIAVSILGDRQYAEECENDTYLVAWNDIPPADPSDHLFAYLARIVRFKAINRYREMNSKKRRAVMTELTKELSECIPSDQNVEGIIDLSVLTQTIERFLRNEDSVSRDLFIRRYFYMESTAELCIHCGLAPSKVYTVLFRMRKRLKGYLEKEGYSV